MNKIALSLLALTALTGAAFANDRTEEGTAASRNVAAMNSDNTTDMSTETAGAGVVTSFGSDSSSFLLNKRYGIELNTGNGND